MTHTLTHMGKWSDGTNGTDRAKCAYYYTERKGFKSPRNCQTERPDTLRNQQVAGSSPASSSTSEQAIQLLAPIFYSVRARGFCCCPVDSAVPFYQKLILLFFEKEGICCGRCLPFWVETAIGFFALQRFSCTAEMNAADAGMLAVAGGLNGVRCPVLGS